MIITVVAMSVKFTATCHFDQMARNGRNLLPYARLSKSSDLSQDVGWRQVEGDAALDILPVLEVSEESEAYVQVGDQTHARVEDTVVGQHVSGVFHLKLQLQ